VKEIANYLRVHQTTVYRLLKSRKVPAFSVGSDWRFNIPEINRWQQHLQGGFHAAGKVQYQSDIYLRATMAS
jgi:excisionase family DNA binding protein